MFEYIFIKKYFDLFMACRVCLKITLCQPRFREEGILSFEDGCPFYVEFKKAGSESAAAIVLTDQFYAL